ncbi:family 16 glycosylhydrolase [Rubellicoccus peritrichatus]|uniref:Family 16 glycosylhydrolase n=1 Tax=Rubellicoccus peritrichatus TaxID=3080537 RepID=A0AAQ3QPQ3_9BACT|nr:family 16 glycosylhydrolase [Puniceicoccus sp. CR14]WOO39308.1 family 16 glycosylhydrolase [Puniceicoccus sp. CR14]
MNLKFVYALYLSLLFISNAMANEALAPPQKGLILELDASNDQSIEFDDDGKVKVWRDVSGSGNDAIVTSPERPEWIADGFNDEPTIRFSGKEWLELSPLNNDNSRGYSIFVVFQRNEDQVSDVGWQRLISSVDQNNPKDTKAPAFHIGTGKNSNAAEPRIEYDILSNTIQAPITIAANQSNNNERLHGDISEVLIYDHSFLVYEQIDAVLTYLQEKWDIEPIPSGDWTFKGPLPKPLPERINNDYPLSDQDNEGDWERFDPLWDEFNEGKLDTKKWWDHNPYWYGRAPARFLARNVRVHDGMLQLAMSKDPSLPEEDFYNSGTIYKDWVSASVVGKTPVNYGYFEIRAKPMASAGSSAWWFTGSSYDREKNIDQRLEIDVFEIGGKAVDKEYSYNMNLHNFKTRDNPKHFSLGGTWKTPERLIDRFWVFGLEWTPEVINYYVDGVLVRKVDNSVWHGPQRMIFDSETMFDWLGIPEDSHLPSIFEVDYVRSWKNTETEGDWEFRYEIKESSSPTAITRYVRSIDPLKDTD